MRMRRSSNALLAAVALACAPAAMAQVPAFSFSGYGTVGVARSDNDRADYLVDAFKPSGPGYTREWNPEVDSRIAGQVTATFTPRITGVVQVIVQQRHDESWEPTVEWANVKWQVTDDFSVRGGRVVLPVFMVTDTRRVGYANPWVRPPVEVYSMVPVTYSDGLDASWKLAMGGGSTTFQLTAGRSDSKFPNSSGFDAGKAEARDLWALNGTWERGPFTARVNYGEAKLTISAFEPYFDAFRQFGPPGEAIAARYGLKDRRVDFLGFGANYDPGSWFAMGEWAHFDTHSAVGAKKAWYVSGGYRFGKFTPYATYADLKPEGPTSDPGLNLTGLPPPVAAVGAQLNAMLNAQLAVIPQQSTASLGVRWDVLRNAALKAQWDYVRVGENSVGTFTNFQPGFRPGGRVNLFSLALDFVF